VAMLLIEAALVASLGLWMAVAVYDNWRHAKLNREAVAMVMRFDLMERDYPDDYKIVAHRRIDSEASSHCVSTPSAWRKRRRHSCCSARPWPALPGSVRRTFAAPTTAALVATTFFILIWAGFIVGGNYFHYYYCHQWGQSNHFMFMYWGFFVLLVLMI
jgi:hypothetical protein